MSFSTQFFASSQNGTTFPLDGASGGNANTPDRRPRQEEKHTCLPVTIRAIEEAVNQQEGGEQIHFYGSEPELLVLVASVESVVKQQTSLEFVVNDATGRIRVRYYAAGDGSGTEVDDILPGRYVHMFGNVRTAPTRHFVAQGVRLVKSADEVSYHTIEVAHATLKLRRGPPTPATTPTKARELPEAALAAAQLSPPKLSEPPVASPSPTAPMAGAAPSGAALRDAVLAFLQKEGDGKAEGVARSAVYAHLKVVPESAVCSCLGELVADGDVFTTLDDDHFSAI